MKLNPLVLKSLLHIGVPFGVGASLFFLLGHEREKSRRSSCQSNLKQMGIAFAQYAQDYDDHLPLPVGGDHSETYGTPPFGWAEALLPYSKSINILYCPSDVWPSLDGQIPKGFFSDYWMNARLSGRKQSALATTIIMVGDGIGDKRGTARYATTAPPTQTPTCGGQGGNCQSAWKHLGGANFLFADGHVKWLLPEGVSARKGDSATFAP